MNILFLCSWYPSRVLPSNGDFIQRCAEAVSLQHNVSVLHIVSDKNSTKNIEISSKTINGISTHIAYIKYSKNMFVKSYRFLLSYLEILKLTPKIDVVHVNVLYPFGLFALHLKWFRKIPFVISEHWTNYKYPLSKKISNTKKILSKIIVKNSAYCCPVTDDLKNSMELFGLKGEYKKVPNVVDIEIFTPSKYKNEVFTFVHVSSMIDKHKNISGILRVVSRLQHHIPNFKFKLIGNNSSTYKSYANDIDISPNHCEFIDHLPQNILVNHIKNSDIFVLFSNYENLPCVILESFACGTPVISSDIGGIKEYFPENFGILIPHRDEDSLLKEIISAYNNRSQFSRKEEMSNYVACNFGKQQICDEFTDLYIKSLNQ